MTDQRIFPFFVNGVYWKKIQIDERAIKEGYFIQCVVTKPQPIFNSDEMPDMMAHMKRVLFQLVECAEQKNRMIANWTQGFWVCDDELYIEDDGLYMKNKESELIGERRR